MISNIVRPVNIQVGDIFTRSFARKNKRITVTVLVVCYVQHDRWKVIVYDPTRVGDILGPADMIVSSEWLASCALIG